MNDNIIDDTGPIWRFLRSYRKSEVIFEESSLGYETYLIHSGKVSLSVEQDEVREMTLVVLGPGNLFGEMALVENTKRSVTTVATEDNTQLIVLDRANFLGMVQQRHQFALNVIRTLCQDLRDPSRCGNCGK